MVTVTNAGLAKMALFSMWDNSETDTDRTLSYILLRSIAVYTERKN